MMMILSILLSPALAGGVGYCEGEWPDATAPTAELNATCAEEWLSFAYPYGTDRNLEVDPGYSDPRIQLFTAEQYTRMASHLNTACPTDVSVCQRATEFFEGCARLRFETFDPDAMASFEPVLAMIIAGEALTASHLEPGGARWSDHSLWRMRNAVFARHGRSFSNADLHRFYYTADAVAGASALPLQDDPNYNDAMLTDADRANVELLLKYERE